MIEVNERALLFLCKTSTKKTLTIKANLLVVLKCEIDEYISEIFFVECKNKTEVKKLSQKCVEWLNY